MEDTQSRGLSTVASSNSFSNTVISDYDRGKLSCNVALFLPLTDRNIVVP
jgi:hypothetical protein